MAGSASLKLVIAGLALVSASVLQTAHAKGPLTSSSTAPIAVAEMPVQGARTYALIARGGPFPYEKDGAVFGNRERLLPLRHRGFYREYTVATPGLQHRGTRRIVCGGKAPAIDNCFYTADHYASFRKIVP